MSYLTIYTPCQINYNKYNIIKYKTHKRHMYICNKYLDEFLMFIVYNYKSLYDKIFLLFIFWYNKKFWYVLYNILSDALYFVIFSWIFLGILLESTDILLCILFAILCISLSVISSFSPIFLDILLFVQYL